MSLKTELKDFQKETLEWMKLQEKKKDNGGMLCNEAGLGKTLNLLALIIEKPKKTLIVCPAGLVDNWVNEIEKHTTLHRLKYVKYYGPNRNTKYIKPDTLIYITSYSIVAKEFDGVSFKKDSLLAKTEFNRIILDEAHYIRNSYSNVAKSVLYLGNSYTRVIKKWVVTATPVYNHVNDTFNYFKFLELEGIDNKKDWTNTITKIDGLYKLNGWMKKHSISLKKKDVLKELKQKNEIKISLKFNKLENDFYESLKSYSHTRMKALMNRIKHLKSFQDTDMKRLLRANVLTFILRLKQACNSPWLILKNMERLKGVDNLEDAIECLNTANLFFEKNKKIPDEDCPVCYDVKGDYIADCGHKCCRNCWDKILEFKGECPVCRAYVDEENLQHTKKKVKKTKERMVDIDDFKNTIKVQKVIELTKMAIENNEKIVIVSQWVGMLNIIRHVFEDELPDVKYINLQGNIPLAQRTKNIEKFETKKSVKVCFLSLMSSSEGINLVSANHLVFVDCWWNKSKMIQGADRIHRIGQTKQVNVYNLQIKDSIEEKIEMLVEKKTKMGNLITNKWGIKNIKKYDDSWIKNVIKLLDPVQTQE